MIADCFVDTNVLVYARDANEPEKQPIAEDLVTWLWATRRARLSVQVLSELYVTVTRKLVPPMDREAARADCRALASWDPVPITADLLQHAFALEDSYALSWWDAAIVAAASRCRCRYLVTEDLQDGLEIAGLRVVDPFASGGTTWRERLDA